MQAWQTLAKRTVLAFGRFLTVESHTIRLPDGRILDEWPWVVSPDYVNVLALDPAGEYLVFRQTKYAVAGTSFAPVGGMIDPGETPLAAAIRELREEMGLRAGSMQPLGSYATDGNRGVNTGHFFLALDCVPVDKAYSDDLEQQELVRLSRSQLRAALLAGEFKVMGWAAIAALALMHPDTQEH